MVVKAASLDSLVNETFSLRDEETKVAISTNIHTIDLLAEAYVNSTKDKYGATLMKEEYALEASEYIMGVFGFEEIIIDFILHPHLRDLFHYFEDEKILKRFKEEDMLYNGKEWRTHYWGINYDRINKLINFIPEKRPKTEKMVDLYNEIKFADEEISWPNQTED